MLRLYASVVIILVSGSCIFPNVHTLYGVFAASAGLHYVIRYTRFAYTACSYYTWLYLLYNKTTWWQCYGIILYAWFIARLSFAFYVFYCLFAYFSIVYYELRFCLLPRQFACFVHMLLCVIVSDSSRYKFCLLDLDSALVAWYIKILIVECSKQSINTLTR